MAPVPEAYADALDDFLAYIELEKGLSRNTAKSYENDLRQAAHQLKRHGAPNWIKVTSKHLTSWLHWLSDENFSESSQARKLAAVRMFFRHLVRQGTRRDDPAALLSGPKFRRKLPEVLTTGEMDRLLAAPAGGNLDEMLAQLARDMGQHHVAVVELHAEHRAREHGDDFALHFDRFAIGTHGVGTETRRCGMRVKRTL